MSTRVVFRNHDGDEVEISLHPISLALLVAEVIEESARRRCLRKGHTPVPDADGDSHCERCGTYLPDTSAEHGLRAWLPDAYRTIRRAKTAETEGAQG